MILTPGPNVSKVITRVIKNVCNKIVFVSGRPYERVLILKKPSYHNNQVYYLRFFVQNLQKQLFKK
jgi:hypothetical protein